jgi:Na+/melibiose symporter-like transporter
MMADLTNLPEGAHQPPMTRKPTHLENLTMITGGLIGIIIFLALLALSIIADGWRYQQWRNLALVAVVLVAAGVAIGGLLEWVK